MLNRWLSSEEFRVMMPIMRTSACVIAFVKSICFLPMHFCDGLYNLQDAMKPCCYLSLKKVSLRQGYQRMHAEKGRRSSSYRNKAQYPAVGSLSQ